MLTDEKRATQVLALGRRGAAGRSAAASVVCGPHGAGRRGQPGIRRDRQDVAATWSLRPDRSRPNPRLHPDTPHPLPSARLPPLSGRLLPALRHGRLPRRAECAGCRRSHHLLAGQRAGRTPLRPSRTAAGPVDCGAVSVHRELRRHGPAGDAGICLDRAGLLRLCALAGRRPGHQPLAVDGCRRAGLLHSAAAGTGPAGRSDSAGNALAVVGNPRTKPPPAPCSSTSSGRRVLRRASAAVVDGAQ